MALSHFYSSSSPFFVDGKIDFCIKCSLEIVTKEGFKGFQNLMKLIDKPIYTDLYENDPGNYIRQMNSLPQYRGLTYEDSNLFDEVKSISSINKIKPKELSEEDLKESEDFWGIGKSERDYIWLNTEFSDYLARYEVDGKTLEDLIVEICLTRLDIRNRREAGNDVDKQMKTLNDLLGSANLRPNQETGNQSADQQTFSEMIRKFENERPIPEPDPLWADVDNIGKYIRTFFLGHMAKMFGKENPFIDEYNEEIGKHTVTPPKKGDV